MQPYFLCYLAASLVHLFHNAEFFSEAPGLPHWTRVGFPYPGPNRCACMYGRTVAGHGINHEWKGLMIEETEIVDYREDYLSSLRGHFSRH